MTFRHYFLQHVLGFLAHRIILKYQPRVIGITGSVGKTMTKEAVAHVMGGDFLVRKNEGNLNTEIGVPLTIIGYVSLPHSLIAWGEVCLKALWLLFHKDSAYPTVLVLEMGADRPGDITALVKIAPCDIGIITAVAHTHLEYFKTVDAVQKEKSVLVRRLKPGGCAVLNHDDTRVFALHNIVKDVMTYGFSKDATLCAQDYRMSINAWLHDARAEVIGESTFKITYGGATVPVRVSGLIGTPIVYAALAAAAIGVRLGHNLHVIVERLSHLHGLPGRLSLVRGVKNTLIIDDTYNSSPRAAVEALTIAGSLTPPGRRIWAVLGDMLELGMYTITAHREVGAAVVSRAHAYALVTVGERAREIGRAAVHAGMKQDTVYEFATTEEAGRFIQNKLQEGDILLVKGSRSMHMEKVVRELMAEPQRADELLVHD